MVPKVWRPRHHQQQNIKFHGVLLDPHLTFKDHITNKSKIEHKMRNFLTADQLKMLMYSLELTHLDYSNAILVNSPDAITKQFQLVQTMQQNCTQHEKMDSATECFKELNWLPVKFTYIYKFLTIVYNALWKEGPMYLQNNWMWSTVKDQPEIQHKTIMQLS